MLVCRLALGSLSYFAASQTRISSSAKRLKRVGQGAALAFHLMIALMGTITLEENLSDGGVWLRLLALAPTVTLVLSLDT